MGWGAEGVPVCGHGAEDDQMGSVEGPSQAGQVELPLGVELLGLWHPGLWHLLVSEVRGEAGAGGAEAVDAGV